MTFSEYQELAMRTQAIKEDNHDMLIHAVCGLSSEIGEINQAYSELLGNANHDGFCIKYDLFKIDRVLSELGDLCWFQAELCKSLDVSLHYMNLDYVTISNFENLSQKDKIDMIGFHIDNLTMLIGLIAGAVQKTYQGKKINIDDIHYINQIMLIEINTIAVYLNSTLEKVWEHNIEKLKKRFPEGFSEDLDAHRKEGDL